MLLPVIDPQTEAEVARIAACFEARDMRWVETPTLLPAEKMLDFYGEDIHDRAYIVHDPIDGDFVLRPDFTVPVVEAHMRSADRSARYAYSGRVWRKSRRDENKRSFWQMGFESFGADDLAREDAEIIALAYDILEGKVSGLKLGDLGLIFAVIDLLSISQKRRDELRRHVWRPHAFAAAVARFSDPSWGEKRADRARAAKFDASVPFVGARSRADIEARLTAMIEDANSPILSAAEQALIARALAVSGTLADAEIAVCELASEFDALVPFAETMRARNAHLTARGLDLSALNFDAQFGRETMEYYDGLVFGTENGALLGGRYDQLSRNLGGRADMSAIGLACRLDRIKEAR